MKERKRASDAERHETPKVKGTLDYITFLMGVTTIIAGWHITDVWSGIVTILCGLATVALIDEITGGTI